MMGRSGCGLEGIMLRNSLVIKMLDGPGTDHAVRSQHPLLSPGASQCCRVKALVARGGCICPRVLP